jgi:hypothetical protein
MREQRRIGGRKTFLPLYLPQVPHRMSNALRCGITYKDIAVGQFALICSRSTHFRSVTRQAVDGIL